MLSVRRKARAISIGGSYGLTIPMELRTMAKALRIPIEGKRYSILFNEVTEEILYRPIELDNEDVKKSD